MGRRVVLVVTGAMLLLAGCSGAPPRETGGGAASPQPQATSASNIPTPTAILSKPVASPSPSPVASPAPSPAPSPSPVAAVSSAPAGGGGAGIRYQVIPDRSEGLYTAREKFLNRELPNEAVGRTRDISGEVVLEQDGVPRGRIQNMKLDLRAIASDSARRDNYVRQNILQVAQHPFVEVNSTEVAGPASYVMGSEAAFSVPTRMIVRGQERQVQWDVKARLEGALLVASGKAVVKLSAMGIPSPSIAGMLTVEDTIAWAVEIVAERQ